MKFETVAIGSISQDPANLRKHDRRGLDAIKASLRRFGQQKVIVVDGDGTIRAGNGTYEAAQELGWPTIVIHRTELVGTEATAYAISDNRTADLSTFKEDDLLRTLESLRDDGVPLEDVGFSDAEVADLLAKLGGQGDDGDPDGDPNGDDSEPGEAGGEVAAPDWAPVIRCEIVFDGVEQQDRWFAFVRYLKGRPEYDAATIAGRIDLFLQAGEFSS